MSTSRVRLWVTGLPGDDYITLDRCQPDIIDSNPTQVQKTQDDREVIVYPSGSSSAQWANRLRLTIPTTLIFELNNSGAATSRNFSAWLEYYVRDSNTKLMAFLDLYGRDSAGNQVNSKLYYTGRILPPLPPVILTRGVRLSKGSTSPYFTLTMIVDGEGTFTDFDDDTSITARSL